MGDRGAQAPAGGYGTAGAIPHRKRDYRLIDLVLSDRDSSPEPDMLVPMKRQRTVSPPLAPVIVPPAEAEKQVVRRKSGRSQKDNHVLEEHERDEDLYWQSVAPLIDERVWRYQQGLMETHADRGTQWIVATAEPRTVLGSFIRFVGMLGGIDGDPDQIGFAYWPAPVVRVWTKRWSDVRYVEQQHIAYFAFGNVGRHIPLRILAAWLRNQPGKRAEKVATLFMECVSGKAGQAGRYFLDMWNGNQPTRLPLERTYL